MVSQDCIYGKARSALWLGVTLFVLGAFVASASDLTNTVGLSKTLRIFGMFVVSFGVVLVVWASRLYNKWVLSALLDWDE